MPSEVVGLMNVRVMQTAASKEDNQLNTKCTSESKAFYTAPVSLAQVHTGSLGSIHLSLS